MNSFFYVYILVSESDSTVHYTGVTSDLGQRLSYHNRGACPQTAAHQPWRVETAIAFKSEERRGRSKNT